MVLCTYVILAMAALKIWPVVRAAQNRQVIGVAAE
jgi:hypothetical protein